MQLIVQMTRLATTVGRQVTWHGIVPMIPSVTCAMFLDMLLDTVQNLAVLEIATVVAVVLVAVGAVVLVVVVTET